MQNKNAVLLFTSLLVLATLYTLSFSWVANNYEKKADDHGKYVADTLLEKNLIPQNAYDAELDRAARAYLRDSADAEIYPLLGFTYREVKERELNLGLDLQGGMSVTLEVSVPELMVALSDYSQNERFVKAINDAKAAQKSSTGEDFVALFGQAWKASSTGTEDLWRIFHTSENRDLFPSELSDDEVLEILQREAETAIQNTENIIRKRIDQLGVAQPNVQRVSGGRILVELPGINDKERARKQLKSTANLEFWETYFNDEVFQRISAANDALGLAMAPELAADTTRTADSLSLEERRAANPLFAVFQPEVQQRSAVVGYSAVSDTSQVNALLARPEALAALGADLRLMWEAKPTNNIARLYAIKDASGKGKAELSGKSIVSASVSYDEIGDVVVSMTMNSEGAAIWSAMTERCANQNQRAVAVVLDNLVFSAPNVQTAIANGRSQISFGSNQSMEDKLREAEDLSGLLKAGALPAPARIVDEYNVGAQLGDDNIRSGLWAFALALIAVLGYMVFYYRRAGWVANLALMANLLFLIGALASLGAALTLPGIAGIVLTIGMAVDANVLIFERIREEMRNGKAYSVALREGFSKAYSSILDANITTLLTAIVLYSFGTGSIRGFATVLIIGIFTSLFSAIVLTRLVFFNLLERKKSVSFGSPLTLNLLTNTHYDFVKNRKKFYLASAVVVVLGLGSLLTRGLQMGVEFSGGTTFDIAFDQPVNIDEVRSTLAQAFSEDGKPGNPVVQTKDGQNKFRVTTNYMINNPSETQDEDIQTALNSGLSSLGTGYKIEQYNKVDSTISDDFRTGAYYATVFSLLIIFLYIFIRFRKWQYGLGAVLALMHDVLIVLGVFSLLSGILPFTMEVDQAFIAAILTVIGYSINDTVVVFDRIRETLGIYGNKHSAERNTNDALNDTLSRTLNTSLTTFVVLLTIFLLAGDNIKSFVFALMVGVAVGTYSSIFIASPITLDFTRKKEDAAA